MPEQALHEANEILRQINENADLHDLELDGFIRGFRAGKTLNVGMQLLLNSLRKQVGDWESIFIDYILGNATLDDLKRRLADIRNVAGVIFLKVCERQKKQKAALEGIGKLFEEE